MKTKINKIFGVALALVLVFGLAGAFIPVNLTEAIGPGTTPNQWQNVSIPGAGTHNLRAADAADIAVAADGKTIYAVDTQTAGILQSPNNGGRWTLLPNPVGIALPPRLVAVSPDDPQAIAIVDSSAAAAGFAAGTVWISNNGGTTWAALAAVAGNAGATSIVTGVAVGPSRSGTILNRDYAVSVADTAATTNGGDVLFQGLNTAWTSCATVGAFAANTFDFTSLIMSPGFLGDRCIFAVGSDTAVGGTAEVGGANGDTYLFIIQTSDVAPLATVVAPPGAVRLDTATTDSPPALNNAGGFAQILASSVALPQDFDPTTAAGRRTFVSWASRLVGGLTVCADDVYRVDNQTVRKLQTGAANGIFSIAYSGTITGGTLIAGESLGTAPIYTLVHHTEDPQLSQPSWATSAKSPTGQTNCVVGIDPADAMLCYAGTSGIESAFSISRNGAVSFNQHSLINTEIDGISDIMLTPDGAGIYMATWDNAVVAATGSASNLDSLWYSPIPTGGSSWDRVRISPIDWGNAVGGSIVRLSPEYLDVPALYWFDAGATNVQRSVDAGNIFSNRTAPAAIADATVENADIVYLCNGANVYSSTNGAWFFGLPVATGVPAFIFDLEMAPTYPEKPVAGNLLASSGVTGGVFYSWNAGAAWRPFDPFIPGSAGGLQVVADPDFDGSSNKTIYAGDPAVGLGIWRFDLDVSTTWEQITAPAGLAMTGLAMSGGTLYGSYDTAGVAPTGALRSLVPDLPVIASWIWENMNVGSAALTFNAAPNALRVASPDSEIYLYAIDTLTGTLWAYNDTMAKNKPELTVPDVVPVDSVTGRNSQFTISWPGMSNATTYEVQIHNDPACSQLVVTSGAVYIPSNPLSPTLVIAPAALVAGQDYFVRARARDQVPGDTIRSNWSSVSRFSVEGGERVEVSYLGVQPLGPLPGATGVPLSPGFTWSPYASSTRYEFKLANDAALTDIVAEAKVSTTGYKYDGTLANNTTYFWAARGIEPTVTAWSPISSFTTEKKAVEPMPPVVIEQPTPAAPVVSQTMIYVIIGIGCILVIAVIVLIVRTRRTV